MDMVVFEIQLKTFILIFKIKGNKKGPINRWDFETNEEYGNYMSNREALPRWEFFITNIFLYMFI